MRLKVALMSWGFVETRQDIRCEVLSIMPASHKSAVRACGRQPGSRGGLVAGRHVGCGAMVGRWTGDGELETGRPLRSLPGGPTES